MLKDNVKITVLGLLGNSVFFTVPHFHRSGETVHADSLYTEPGGKGSNQAVAAANLGAQLCFISCMGDDAIASECLGYMSGRGVRCLTETVKNASSPCAAILTDREGENQVTVYRGSADFLSPDFVRACEDEIRTADVLLLNNECPLEANLAALDMAERWGVPAILNPAPYTELPSEYLSRFYMITPNRHEALSLLGEEDASVRDILTGLAAIGIKRAVVTLGADGAAGYDGEHMYLCPPIRSVAVDTTGAGDCFNGALALCVGRGMNMRDCVEYAVNASALSVRKKYVMPSLPDEEELRREWTDLDIECQ